MHKFDFVVVGAGSAGCTVASRLSENGKYQVALLEAGGSHNNPLISIPFNFAFTVPKGPHNWSFETVPQEGLNGRRGYQPRGKVLGGSSSINAMVYIRGAKEDYEHWAALGNEGWSYEEVLPFFKKAQNRVKGANEVSVRARGVISGVGDGVFRGGACPTPECGVAGGHRVHRYGGVCTLQP